MGQLDGDTTGNCHVAIAIQQRFGCVMHCDQRCGTGSLQVDAWAFQVQHMADAGRQKVFVIARMAQQEHPHIVHQFGVGTDVEIEIAAHSAACINTDLAADRFRRVAGVFQRFPGNFQKLAMLRIKDRRLFRAEPKEFRVELVEPL